MQTLKLHVKRLALIKQEVSCFSSRTMQTSRLLELMSFVTAVTPNALPGPQKSARIARVFEFKRDEHSTVVIATKITQTLQDLKHIYAREQEDLVFKFPSVDTNALKGKIKILGIVIGDEIEQQYEEVKGLTVEEILQILSPEKGNSHRIVLELKLKDANNGGGSDMNGLETYSSE